MGDGSSKPVEDVAVGDEVLSAYGSGEFRPARVIRTHRAQTAEGVAITTSSGRRIVSTHDHVHFAGFLYGQSPQQHMTYLMYKRGKGYRVGTSRTYTKGQRQPMFGPAQRANAEAADAVWVVSVHATEAAARYAESYLAAQYGLPTVPFAARRYKDCGDRSLVASQELIDRLFASLDTETGGEQLLRDEGLRFAHPHHRPATHTAGTDGARRRNLTVTLCGDRRGARPMHRLALFGYDDEGRRRLEDMGLSVRPARQGSEGWRFETAAADYGATLQTARLVAQALPEVHLRPMARIATNARGSRTGSSLPFMPASSVRPGMVMVGKDGEYDVVTSVDRVTLDQPVYDLDIENTHNFVAAGLVTHNSIYSFRGADISNILSFESGLSRRQGRQARAELPLDADRARRGQRGHRAQPRSEDEGAVDRPRQGRPDHRARARRRAQRGAVRRRRDRPARRRGRVARGDRDLLPDQRDVAGARGHAGAARGRLPGRRRDEVLRPRGDQGRDGVPALAEQPAGRHLVLADRQLAQARHRADVGRPVLSHAATMGISPWEAAEAPDQVPGLGTAAVKAFTRPS
jgi:hypothetical protein